MSRADDFPVKVIKTIAERAAYFCSNPDCRRLTTGPHSDPAKSAINGEAAHINAVAEMGPRYNPRQTQDERRGADNAIWLCSDCHTLIDRDSAAYPTRKLHSWKEQHEKWVASQRWMQRRKKTMTATRKNKNISAAKPAAKRKPAARPSAITDFEWSAKELKEKLKSFKRLFEKLQQVPRTTRSLLATIIERMQDHSVPSREIEHATGSYHRDFYDEFEILNYHGIAYIEEDGYIYLAQRDRETWDDLRYYCKVRDIDLTKLIRDLDLDSLEQ